uniref:Uncharacterized protein n=1 Tax=Rhizophora mucronata TaxID=61149 RepID=A0A2P2PW21_RHIMU
MCQFAQSTSASSIRFILKTKVQLSSHSATHMTICHQSHVCSMLMF